MNRLCKVYFFLGAMTALISVSGIYYYENSNEKYTTPMTNEQYFVKKGDIKISISAIGYIEPENYVDVGGEVNGRLLKLLVDQGDFVEKDSLIALIDPSLAEDQVREAKATLDYLKATLSERIHKQKLARTEMLRNKRLYHKGIISEIDYLRIETSSKVADSQLNSINAQIKQAIASLSQAETNLDRTKIYAPISGVVLNILIRAGQIINTNSNTPILMRIANLENMIVRVKISEADINKINTNMIAQFTLLGYPDKIFSGKIFNIIPYPNVNNNVVSYDALFKVDNKDYFLKPNMTAQVVIVVKKAQNVNIIPINAIKRIPNKSKKAIVVLYDKKNDTYTYKQIEVGIQSREYIEVVSGLTCEDIICAKWRTLE